MHFALPNERKKFPQALPTYERVCIWAREGKEGKTAQGPSPLHELHEASDAQARFSALRLKLCLPQNIIF